jgi:N-acetylglucosamine-6-phosphate deacetylase
MLRILSAWCARAAALGAATLSLSITAGQPTGLSPLNPPPNGPRRADATWHALWNATVHVRPDTTVEHGTVIVRDGRIESVLPATGDTPAEAPPGARVWDCTGLHLYPGFIDAYVETEAPRPDPDQPGVHWNARVTPQRSALDGAGVDDKTAESLRKLGFTAAAISPQGGIFRGRAAVVSLAQPAGDLSADRPPVYALNAYHALGFDLGRVRGVRPAGGAREGPDVARWSQYPDSEMGVIALMRQTFIDEEWQEEARKAGRPLAYNAIDTLAPEWARNAPDRTIAAPNVGDPDGPQPMPLLFDCDDELEEVRAAKVAREFKRPAVLLGSGYEFRRLDAIKADGLPIVLPLRYPKAPDVSTIGKAESVDLRELMTWEQAPTNPRRLDAAGVKVALTTARLKSRAEFSENLTKALKHGLPPERALAMLTTQPAEILGVSDRLGAIEPGKIADLVVADGDLFEAWPKKEVTKRQRDGETKGEHGKATQPAAADKPTEAKPKVMPPGGEGQQPAGKEGQPEAKPDTKTAERQREEKKENAPPPAPDKPREAGEPAAATPPGTTSDTNDAAEKDSARAREPKRAQIRDVWIDGVRHEINAAPGVKLEGDWTVKLDPGPEGLRLSIDDKNAITVRLGDKKVKARGVKIADRRLSFLVDDSELGLQGVSTVSGVAEGDEIYGTGIDHDGTPFTWTATRATPGEPGDRSEAKKDDGPPPEHAAAAKEPPAPDERAKNEPGASETAAKPKRKDAEQEERDAIAAIPEALGYPFGPYMLEKTPEQEDLVFTNATVWTEGPQGIIQNGWVAIRNGKITGVGSGSPPSGGRVVDCKGKHISPGVIDCHSHTGISKGVNESGEAVTAEVRIQDVTDPDSISWYRQLASGVTTVNSLHGSANAIGGQNCVNKIRWGVPHPDQMHFEGAMPGIKFALGENPKQSNWGDRSTVRYPQTRMGVEAIIRDRFAAAKEYLTQMKGRQWMTDVRDSAISQSQTSGTDPKLRRAVEEAAKNLAFPFPRRDLELEALAEVLEGKRLVHCHSYRQDELLMLCRVADDFQFKIGTFQHVLEGYKVADEIAKHALGGSCFSDWWAYKVEVQDAIPQDGPIMAEQGVTVSFNSDSDELARRLNWEAAKAIKYGQNVKPEAALAFVTINPARQLMIDKQVGSLEPGKDADLAIWSGPPMSAFSRCEATYVDGRRLFSLEDDAKHREKITSERHRIIQKLLASAGARHAPDSDAGDHPRAGRRPADDLERFYLDLLNRGGNPDAARPGECGLVGH